MEDRRQKTKVKHQYLDASSCVERNFHKSPVSPASLNWQIAGLPGGLDSRWVRLKNCHPIPYPNHSFIVFPIRLAMQWGTGPDFLTQLINTLVRKVFNNQHQPSNTHQHQWTPINTHSSSINTNQNMFVHQSAPIFRKANPNKTNQHHFYQWKAIVFTNHK